MTAPAHAWMPMSHCGSGCVDAPSAQVGTARVAARAGAVLGLVLAYPLAHVLTPPVRRPALRRGLARTLLRCCGIRLRVIHERVVSEQESPERMISEQVAEEQVRVSRRAAGVLVVAGHVSWLDVVVLTAVRPTGFVARADLIAWPLLGAVARLVRVIPIDRDRLRQLPAVVDEIGARLAAGHAVAVFPEGTRWCGRSYGRMRPALFQAAVDTGTPVRLVRLRYLDREVLTTLPSFIAADTMLDSAHRLLRSRSLVAEVVVMPLEEPGLDRRELASRCEWAVRGARPHAEPPTRRLQRVSKVIVPQLNSVNCGRSRR